MLQRPGGYTPPFRIPVRPMHQMPGDVIAVPPAMCMGLGEIEGGRRVSSKTFPVRRNEPLTLVLRVRPTAFWAKRFRTACHVSSSTMASCSPG